MRPIGLLSHGRRPTVPTAPTPLLPGDKDGPGGGAMGGCQGAVRGAGFLRVGVLPQPNTSTAGSLLGVLGMPSPVPWFLLGWGRSAELGSASRCL